MPATVNGIGTGYWGKKNLVAHPGICDHCGKPTELRSYDTWYCFVVLFIPVIPLGKRRIIDQCGICSKHHVSKLADWERLKAEAVTKVTGAYKADPGDPDKATELIATLISFKDEHLFKQVAPVLERQSVHHAGNLCLLAVGHNLFNDLAKEEGCYRAALAADDQPATREALADCLVRLGRADEAIPFATHILDTVDRNKIGFLVYLVQGLQASGHHGDAGELLGRMAAVFPEQAETKLFKKLQRISLKYRATGKKVGRVQGAQNSGGRGCGLGLVMLIGIPLLIGGFLFVADIEANRLKVHLVNGVYRVYQVTVNGEPVVLPRQTEQIITLKEGAIHLSYKDATGNLVERDLNISRPLLTRLFDRTAYVINPDGGALIIWEWTEYSARPSSDSDDEQRFLLSAGQYLYKFKNPDYRFVEFPDQITVDHWTGITRKTRIDRLKTSSVADLLSFVGFLKDDEIVDLFQNQLLFDPTLAPALDAYIQMAPRGQAISFLKRKLKKRPLLVEWHRAYQSLTEPQDQKALEQEYRGQLAEDPENRDLMYLLGRVLRVPAESLALFREAAEGESPSVHAMNAIAYHFLCLGQFDEGLKWSRMARERDGKNENFVSTQQDLLLGAGKFTELLKANQTKIEATPSAGHLLDERVRLLAAAERRSEINSLLATSIAKITDDKDLQEEWRSYLTAVDAYAAGDVTSFAELATHPSLTLEGMLARNEIEQALAKIDADELPASAWTYLAVTALATSQGLGDAAQRSMDKALEFLSEGPLEERDLGSMLQSDSVDLQRGLDLEMPPQHKRLALVVLGQRAPRHRAQFFRLAASLNYDRYFPYLTVSRVLKGRS